MAVDITIGDKPYWNASGYNVVEDATPIDPSSNTGGVGQFTFDLPEDADSKTLTGKTATLSDGAQGVTEGIIRSVSGDGTTVTVTADSRMSVLNVTRIAQPFVGTLKDAFLYYFGLVGLVDGIVIDDSLATRTVILPGWSGVVWDRVKMLAIAQAVEVSLVSKNVVVRELRQRVAENYRDSSVKWARDSTGLAQSVEVYYYDSEQRFGSLVYPLGGWNENVQVYQVDAGETQVIDIPLTPAEGVGPSISLTSIQQPTCVDWVDRDYTATSVYAVQGTGEGNTLPIPPAEWLAGGGAIGVEINPDTTSLKVTIVGSKETQYAPYMIAMTAGPSDSYSSLRLVGDGVFSDKQVLTLHTGLDADTAPTVIGATIDNPNVQDIGQAFDIGLTALGSFAAPKQSLTVSTTGINRVGDTGSYRYSTMDEANVEYAGLTMDQVNALWPGATMDDVSAYWKAKTQGDFVNQAFGNVAGARVLSGGAWYRIASVPTSGPESLTYTADLDVTADDLNSAYSGLTRDEVSTKFAGATMADFNTAPIRTA